MKVFNFLFPIICVAFGLSVSTDVQAQQMDNTLSTSATSAVCIWPVSGLRESPGKSGGYVEAINYGERVQVLGEMKYVPDEDRVYMKVISTAGKEGWVHKYLYEDGADMVVVKQPASIYEKAGELGTLTNDKFEPGELVAMTSFEDGWIHLVSSKRALKGWIQWNDKSEAISIEDGDIALAKLMIKAEQQDSDFDEVQSLKALRSQDGFASSPVRPAVERRISNIQGDLNTRSVQRQAKAVTQRTRSNTQPTTGGDAELQRLISLNGPIPGSESAPSAVGSFTAKSINANPNYNEVLVQDETSGKEYIKVTEKGSVYEVKTVENAPSVYYAYHKTLPKGTHILLSIPGNPGFVELEVTNVLAQNRDQVIALPREVIDAVWGTGANSKDVEATLVYFVKK